MTNQVGGERSNDGERKQEHSEGVGGLKREAIVETRQLLHLHDGDEESLGSEHGDGDHEEDVGPHTQLECGRRDGEYLGLEHYNDNDDDDDIDEKHLEDKKEEEDGIPHL